MICEYWDQNPDPLAEGCIVTREHEPGVIFPGIDVFGYSSCFIGRSAILEAASKVLGVTPDDVNAITSHVERLKVLEADLAEVTAERDRYRAIIDALNRTLVTGDQGESPSAPKRTKAKAKAEVPADLE